MAKELFISQDAAVRRYGKDLRTLKEWVRRDTLRGYCLNPEARKTYWMFESPEARYERVMGESL
jgi:hypothetical protein